MTESWVTPQNVLLLVVALLQAGQWVQKQLNSDVNLAEKIDGLAKQVAEIKAQLRNDYVARDVYRSDQRAIDRRLSSLERHTWPGTYLGRKGDDS